LVEIALGSNVVAVVVVVVPVLVVVVPEPEPLDVPVDVEAVVVVFFEPPCAEEPVVFVVAFVVPPPLVFVLDGPCVDGPPPFVVDVPTLGDVVGALLDPAPRPCAAAVVLTRLQLSLSRVGTLTTGTASAFDRSLAHRYGYDLLTLRLLSLFQRGDVVLDAAAFE
jgi:hypothetical protein